MSAIAFDSLMFAKRLKEAGFTSKQAEVLVEEQVEIFENNETATKEDIAYIKKDLKEMELTLRKEIAESKVEIIKWVVGLLLAQTGVIVVLVKIIN